MATREERSTETTTTPPEVRPFRIDVPEEDLDDLRRRIAATRWPERETVDDSSQGVRLATIRELARYWGTDYDFRRFEARLNALPQFITEIDGLDIHFIHVKSPHEDALPLIITHGWPGSVIEMLEVVGPLTDPTAHGGSAEDAFDVVIPSMPGYGFSGEPREVGWDAGRIAGAWAELMSRLGYTRYVAQGGDQGAGVTDAMGRQAPEGLLGIHFNFLARDPAGAPDGRPQHQARVLHGGPRGVKQGRRGLHARLHRSRWASTRRRSATPCWTHRWVWRPGCWTTTRTATRRSLAPSSTASPRATSPASTSSTTSRCTG